MQFTKSLSSFAVEFVHLFLLSCITTLRFGQSCTALILPCLSAVHTMLNIRRPDVQYKCA